METHMTEFLNCKLGCKLGVPILREKKIML